MKWLEDSGDSIENANTCIARWGGCRRRQDDNQDDACCDGLVCRYIHEWYSQCLHPSE